MEHPSVAIEIVRFVGDYQPGWVECVLVDAEGQSHIFVEKAPIVSADNLWVDSTYSCVGSLACEVEQEWTDSDGRSLVRVSTERPWQIESESGVTKFVVLASQVNRT